MIRSVGWAAVVSGALAFATASIAGVAGAETPATFDTLDVKSVLDRRGAALDSLLLPTSVTFDTTGLSTLSDSLDRGGAPVAQQMKKQARVGERSSLSVEPRPLALSTYNRVDGMRVGGGIAPRYGRNLRAELVAGYGFGSHEWGGRAALEIGPSQGPLLRTEWSDLIVPFGPRPEGEAFGFMSLVFGQDRRDYLRRREFEAGIWPWRKERSWLGLLYFDRDDDSREASTDFNLIGGGVPMDEPNPSVDAVRVRGGALAARLSRARGGPWIDLEAGFADGGAEWAWQEIRAHVDQIITGGTLSLEVGGMNIAGTPPVQDVAYLGGDANLRGFDRNEFIGKRRATARVEYALGIDLLARTSIPLVEKLHLQFIPFSDLGTTWGETAAIETANPPLEGDAGLSFGLGVQRTLWVPGLWKVRLDIARRTDRNDDAWTFWLRALPLE